MSVTAVATPVGPQVSAPSQVKAEVEARVKKAYETEGYVKPDGSPDNEAMRSAAYKIVRTRIVTSKADRATKSITKGELYAAVFPKGPGADGKGEPVDEFDRVVMAQLERDVWSLTQPKAAGAMQRMLDEEDSSMLLVRAHVRRNMDRVPAVYLTDNTTLIMEDSADAEIKSFERKAENLRKEIDMIAKRHPELGDKLRSELGQALNRAKAELTLPKAQVAAALNAGASADGETEGQAAV